MIIRNNIPGINATRNKGISEGRMKKSLEKLSSGYRINRAGDDAAGLAISELMRNQIKGLDQAMKNCNDGISFTNTGDGALAEVHSMLSRMKTLAVQSANGTYNSVARANLDKEREKLLEEIDRIGETSHFAGIQLFGHHDDPKGPPLPEIVAGDDVVFQVGPSAEETLVMERYYIGSENLGLKKSSTFKTIDDANKAIPDIEAAIEAVADVRATFGAASNRLEHAYNNLYVTDENMNAAESQIRDTDMADEFTEFTKDNIIFQSANAMAAQANSTVELVLNLLQ